MFRVVLLGLTAILVLSLACDNDPTGSTTPEHILSVLLDGVGDGRVTSTPAGIDCDGPDGTCSASFEEGTQVTLTATPDDGSTLAAWEGAGSGTASRVVTMNAAASVTASFDHPARSATVIGAGGGIAESRDGRLSLVFPAGALSSSERVMIEVRSGDELTGDLAEIVGALGAANVYEITPSGVSFEVPVGVHVRSGVLPVQEVDSVVLPVGLLLTADDGAADILDGLAAGIDEETGEIVLSGALLHFSPLVDYADQPGGAILFEVTGVPAEVEVGSTFIAQVRVTGPVSGMLRAVAPATFTDQSTSPIVRNFDPATATLAAAGDGIFTGSFEYRCDAVGADLFGAEIAAGVRFTLGSGDVIEAETWSRPRKLVACVEPPPPPAVAIHVIKEGEGLIESDPQGIMCGDGCESQTHHFPEGTEVVLTVTPAEYWVFREWWVHPANPGSAEHCQGTKTPCTMTLDVETEIAAHLQAPLIRKVKVGMGGPQPGEVKLIVDGNHTWYLVCVKDDEDVAECAGEVETEDGSEPTLVVTATPETEDAVVVFTGCEATDDPNVCERKLGADETDVEVGVSFNDVGALATLQVEVVGQGTVTVRYVSPPCGSQCEFLLPTAAEYNLDPRAAAGHTFLKWEAPTACTDKYGTCPLTVGEDDLVISAVAHFVPVSITTELFFTIVNFIEAIRVAGALGFPIPVSPPGEILAAGTMALEPVSPDCPVMVAAGSEAAVAFKSCTGEILTEYPMAGFTAYDALPLPRPAGQTGSHGLLMSGAGFRSCPINDQGELDGFCHVSFGTHNYEDAVYRSAEPSDGAIMVNRTWNRLDLAEFVPGGSFIVQQDWIPTDLLPAGVRTVVPNAAGTKLLAIGAGQTVDWMYMLDLTQDPIAQSGTQDAGSARRIRCDLDAQLCAISRYGGSSSTRRVDFFRWDGETRPWQMENQSWQAVTIATHGLAHGPVGIDVMGNRIVSAGFVDHQYSIITVDLDDPASFTVVTAAAPEGCTSPGHAVFMRDSMNSVLLSCHGSGGYAIIPNAFP